jgi:short-subunit dehydrogenase
VPPLVYADDFDFARDYMGMNIVITGATGTIGSRLVDQFVQNFLPGQVKLALFCKEDDTLPTRVQSQCAVPIHDPNKWIYSYEVDFLNPVRTTTRIQQMMKEMNGVIDCIFFCHGCLNFLGGITSGVLEYDTINKVNVRATMHFMSICMPFLRMKKQDRDNR